jgi:hypothetical protein
MGGAHPMTAKTYQSFKLNSGEKIFIEDSTILHKLTPLAEKEFRRVKNISVGNSLLNEGYWFENGEFYLNDNFAVVKEGLVFYYNPYEIAPYALGPTEIFLTGGEIDKIVIQILKN